MIFDFQVDTKDTGAVCCAGCGKEFTEPPLFFVNGKAGIVILVCGKKCTELYEMTQRNGRFNWFPENKEANEP